MDRFRERVQNHKTLAWILTLAYTIFCGCFSFPFSNELFPFGYSKAITFIIGYGIIGMCFAGLLAKRKERMVLLLSLGCTAIGLLCRYALEYGEVSNAMNFTPLNILAYIIAVPLYCAAVYWCIYKFDDNRDS